MNRSHLRSLGLVAPLALMLGACVDAPVQLRADVAWRLSCAGTIMGGTCPALTISGMAWDYIQYAGEEATDETTGASLGVLSAECEAYDVGDSYLLTLRAAVLGSIGRESEIDLQSLRVSKDTLTYTGGGNASFRAGPNTYGGGTLGAISSAAPTIDVPCQITQFTIDLGTSEGTQVDLRLGCDGVPNVASPTSKVSIRDAGAAAQPALLRFTGCSGFPSH